MAWCDSLTEFKLPPAFQRWELTWIYAPESGVTCLTGAYFLQQHKKAQRIP